MTTPASDQAYIIIKIGEGFALYNQEEEQIFVVPEQEQATAFPAEVGPQIVDALKQAGVEEEITAIPVAITDGPVGEA